MSRSYFTDMTNFFDENGSVANILPQKAKKLADTVGAIVNQVTSEPDTIHKSNIVCWNTLSRKRCKGMIDASIELGSLDIIWHCLACGDHGLIRHWQNTFWDNGHR